MTKQEAPTKCPNKRHTKFIGRLMLSVQVAEDYWAYQQGSLLHRSYFAVTKVTDTKGISMLTVIVHKLSFAFAWV